MNALKKPTRVITEPLENIFSAIRAFMKMQAAGGILLVIFAVIALIIANTPLYEHYNYILNLVKFTVGFSSYDEAMALNIHKSILLWINDGFMAIFFLLVGLEIKREIKEGELSTKERAILPAIAAVGGMIIPAAIYYWINMDTPENLRGWAIPAATDIAFALGVLALLGTRAPIRLKILLTAIAVIDDLGAILIIAFFYTENVVVEPLYFGLTALALMAVLNARGTKSIAPFMLLGLILWVAVLKSGVHATLAGVITALFIPMRCPHDMNNDGVIEEGEVYSPCKTLEHALHPWVVFFILPLFALANAGVPFDGMGLHSFLDPVTLGIILGLVVGKQIGIFSFLWLTIKMGLSPMPKGVSWMHLYGVSALCGIGFTMSLFIGGLAFDDIAHQASIRLGVLTGSTISAIVGFAVIYFAPQAEDPEPTPESEWKDEDRAFGKKKAIAAEGDPANAMQPDRNTSL